VVWKKSYEERAHILSKCSLYNFEYLADLGVHLLPTIAKLTTLQIPHYLDSEIFFFYFYFLNIHYVKNVPIKIATTLTN
jgi:hypothetical protein